MLTVRSASAFGSPGRGAATIGRGVRAVGRPGAVGRQLDQAPAGGFVGRAHRLGGRPRRRGRRRRGHHHVVDQHDALAPVVEGTELADDDECGVGMAQVVVGHVGEALDLAHHVVAEIPDQPAVQRRQPGAAPATGTRHHGLHRGQDPVVGAGRPRRPVVSTCRPRAVERGQRAAPHEGVAAPPLAALDGLEEEAVPLAHDVGKAGDRRQGVGDHLAARPARSCAPWPARRTRRGRGGSPGRPPTARGPDRLRRSRRGHSRAACRWSGRSTSAPRCGRPRGRAGRPGRPGRHRHSPCAPRARTGGPRGLALLPVLLAAAAVEPAAPVSRVRRSASASM